MGSVTSVKITHDKETGAVYIYLTKDAEKCEVARTVPLSEERGVYVDVSSDGQPLGIEALSFKGLAEVIDSVGGELDTTMLHRIFEYRANAASEVEDPLKPEPDAVDHPAHYGGDGTYEAIRVIEAWGCNFNVGNALKYLCRYREKNGAEDLRKSLWYIQREIEGMEAGDE